MKRNAPRELQTDDNVTPGAQRQFVWKPYANLTVHQILEALKGLSESELGSVVKASTKLYATQTAPRHPFLPPDIWKLIFKETPSIKDFHSLSVSSALYESIDILWNLKTVCKAWQTLISEALIDIRTTYRLQTPLYHRTLYLANTFGNIPIFEFLIADYNWESGRKFGLELASCFGETKMVRHLITNHNLDPTFNSDYPLRLAVKTGHTEAVNLLLQDPRVSPDVEHNYAIECASECGYADIVELLLQHPKVNPDDNDSLSIQVASNMGHADVVELLLKDPRVSPEADDNYAILRASAEGHVEVVRLLLSHPRVQPQTHGNMPIKIAAENGFTKVVEALLNDPRVSPEDGGNAAVKRAIKHGRTDVVRLLMADDRVYRHAHTPNLLGMAIEANNLEIVQFLTSLPCFDLPICKLGLQQSQAYGLSHLQISEFLSTASPLFLLAH